jgi:hypothetical protein
VAEDRQAPQLGSDHWSLCKVPDACGDTLGAHEHPNFAGRGDSGNGYAAPARMQSPHPDA